MVPCVLAVAPHRGWIDPFLLLLAWPRDAPRLAWFGDGPTMARSWWRRRLFPRLGMIPTRPGAGPGAIREHLADVRTVLGRGSCVEVFPEKGPRSPRGRTRTIAPGASWLAAAGGVPLVPVAIGGFLRRASGHGTGCASWSRSCRRRSRRKRPMDGARRVSRPTRSARRSPWRCASSRRGAHGRTRTGGSPGCSASSTDLATAGARPWTHGREAGGIRDHDGPDRPHHCDPARQRRALAFIPGSGRGAPSSWMTTSTFRGRRRAPSAGRIGSDPGAGHARAGVVARRADL